MSSYLESLFKAKHSTTSRCSGGSSGGNRVWLLNALPRCRIRRLLLLLSFLDTLCTRVGISQGYNQGKQHKHIHYRVSETYCKKILKLNEYCNVKSTLMYIVAYCREMQLHHLVSEQDQDLYFYQIEWTPHLTMQLASINAYPVLIR